MNDLPEEYTTPFSAWRDDCVRLQKHCCVLLKNSSSSFRKMIHTTSATLAGESESSKSDASDIVAKSTTTDALKKNCSPACSSRILSQDL